MALYHKTIGFPAKLKLPRGCYRVRYSKHALEKAAYLKHYLPRRLNTNISDIIEVETDQHGVCCKIVCRQVLDPMRDICFAVATDRYPFCVKTLWVNKRKDHHQTLKTERYTKP